MAKQNCWEFKKCGREPGGSKSAELGVCPAATEKRVNRIHGGLNGGRSCWALTGTFCGGAVQGTFASKLKNCMDCEFYKLVGAEEGAGYEGAKAILARLH
ncbi:MAG TPA: hypothetical protein VMF59_11845 [Bacteroidota bacterium]|nr:hypothetical protein [Bacteroidota bacterium]